MSTDETRAVMTRYFESDHTDSSMMSDDATFTVMATGEAHRGPQAIQGLLDYFYRQAFDAHAQVRNTLFLEGHAVWEGHFVGRHTGEFAGVPPTGKEVCVPLCVVYDLQDGRIHRGRIYIELPVLLKQLGVG